MESSRAAAPARLRAPADRRSTCRRARDRRPMRAPRDARDACERSAARSRRSRPVQHALPQPRAVLHLRGGRRADLFHQRRRKLVDAQRNRAFGLQHEIDGTETQGFERRLGAFRRQRRHHDHGARPLDHDAVEAFEAAHLRHVHVERDDGRAKLLELLQRLERRCARTRTSKSGSLAEHARRTACGPARSHRRREP